MPDLPESLFARGDDDALIRQEKKTRADFAGRVSLTIDGDEVVVPRATPVKDAQGNLLLGPDGGPIPRATTIYDAAAQLVRERRWSDQQLAERIPTLCHRDHLDPVAMCRVCSVHVSRLRKRDRGNPNARPQPADKLVPACQHEVQPEMIVTTRAGGGPGAPFARQVGDSVRVLTELLLADHYHPDPARDDRYINELAQVAVAGGLAAQVAAAEDGRRDDLRFHPRPAGPAGRNFDRHPKSRPLTVLDDRPAAPDAVPPGLPYSSRSFQVDHDRCILCDRCVRACSDVRDFQVIGHTGKGYRTRISFDLDVGMNASSCVQCGECMTACPTGAITFNRRVNPLRSFRDAADLEAGVPPDYDAPPGDSGPHPRLRYYDHPGRPLPAEFVSAADLVADPRKTVFWERSPAPPGENGPRAVASLGSPFEGIPYAYLRWNEGAVRLRRVQPGDVLCRQGEFGSTAFLIKSGTFRVRRAVAPAAGRAGRRPGPPIVREYTVGPDSRVVGEMACLSHMPRSATVTATTAGEVLEVMRNLLVMMQRTPWVRDVLGRVYRDRALANGLEDGHVFAGLSDPQRTVVMAELGPAAELITARPGDVIVRQGDRVGTGADRSFRGDFYIVRRGSVKVSRAAGGGEVVLARLGPADSFGEVALLSDHPAVAPRLPPGFDPSQRTATVTALDEVEVARVRGDAFRRLWQSHPDIAEVLAARCLETLRQPPPPAQLGTHLEQGFFQGQKMLVLDLERCTRCDECTRACADSHGDGISRLLRDGPRLGRFLVATSCRSCRTPYCIDECPVDAIHRGEKSLEVRIDSHCIGCGLCANNCPYESIQMVAKSAAAGNDRRVAAVAHQAVNCDLCEPLGADPFCVSACPHDAAFRWDEGRLLREATGRR